MNFVLFDDVERFRFLPLTFTRPVAEIRIGITTITEKWSLILKGQAFFQTESYLQKKYPGLANDDAIYINGRYLPDEKLIIAIRQLESNQYLSFGDDIIASTFNPKNIPAQSKKMEYSGEPIYISRLSDIFSKNGEAISLDFENLAGNRLSQVVHESNCIIGDPNLVFLEPGAEVYHSSLNTMDGPIYIGKDSSVMEGSMIRGPFALCDHSTVKMGAKIYGPTTIGPHSKIGGEVNNSVILGYSNKAHDGFLGNSVLGEWCNLGADTNNSNLKNNYAEVRLWDYHEERFVGTGLTFCGLIMGDHSKCAINTQFNTGTVVGVCSNLFGAGFPRNFVPSFSWGGAQKMIEYKLEKTFEVAEIVFKRRNMDFDAIEKDILSNVFDLTSKYRN